jgi:transposase
MNSERLNTIFRLHHGENWSIRRIARHLRMSRTTVARYLREPARPRSVVHRASKLDPYKPAIDDWITQNPRVSAVVIAQRLRPAGYTGGLSILKNHLRQIRPARRPARAFLSVAPPPGECFEIDWGHFDALDYEGDKRKLYAFVCVEGHSRLLYLEFTHSQRFETFLRCHQHAFDFFGGVARHLVYDNLASAVAEHDGRVVRFQPRFLAFAREYSFCPRACNPAAPWEKGKTERAIGYIRGNFWPLRSFSDLEDINRQARQWRDDVANQRRHAETRQTPRERFRPEALQPLPAITPDYRDTESLLVHTNFRVQFDANRYCVPPRLVGLHLTLKADSQAVVLYHRHREIVRYPRCWRRGKTLGEERYARELLAERPGARRSAAQQRLTDLLGEAAETYLAGLARSDRSLSRNIDQLLESVRIYGAPAVRGAMEKAQAAGAFGATTSPTCSSRDIPLAPFSPRCA